MEMSPQSDAPSHPEFEDQQMHQYGKYGINIGSEEQCRKKLPDRQYEPNSPSSMAESQEASRFKDRTSGGKRVIFQDQPKREVDHANVKKDLFSHSDNKYQSSQKSPSQYASESEPQSMQKQQRNKPDYDHFHDESMSKLEAVLQRQRERLENLGGFSGKSSQISQGNDEQNLEEAYQDLENEIYNIKRNLEQSQNSGTAYSPMKMDMSDRQDDMDLSPSDMHYDDM